MSQRRPLIAGNWKMNKTLDESVAFAKELVEAVGSTPDVDVVIAPTTVTLHAVSQVIADSPIQLSAQNVHPQPSGAYTGEVSPAMLKAVGCTYAIVGHSERRQYFEESDAFIREKSDALRAEGVLPIVCIGESLEEREGGQTFSRVEAQLKAALEGLSAEEAKTLTIAYEPIWAIGTGKTATPAQAQEVHHFLRQQIATLVDQDTANSVRLLYGGSVKPSNVVALMQEDDIDGALVGGASLKVDSFRQLVHFQS
ncbi:MAG TPA: triose-phosphate isomerase [Myxococcales bacterium]|nr:triose-phosphate isomerase [Deltaproteobacteria bacterium]HAA59199.1 triose-phosphate isomerase [Myxococcales bacterium]|tara:strand:- start:30843 stop:31604 length:762 start_codon:yes stop_codon:yes gene_type:complete